mmetsp:Transcript_41762/g.67748  ORF Transcript_41762/g.67748 Transcript_41762/m.67748 type:complete len:251 (-) Transcript_41762:753-1505(-)
MVSTCSVCSPSRLSNSSCRISTSSRSIRYLCSALKSSRRREIVLFCFSMSSSNATICSFKASASSCSCATFSGDRFSSSASLFLSSLTSTPTSTSFFSISGLSASTSEAVIEGVISADADADPVPTEGDPSLRGERPSALISSSCFSSNSPRLTADSFSTCNVMTLCSISASLRAREDSRQCPPGSLSSPGTVAANFGLGLLVVSSCCCGLLAASFLAEATCFSSSTICLANNAMADFDWLTAVSFSSRH